MEDGDVLGDRNLAGRDVKRLEVGVRRAAAVIAQLGARDLELGPQFDDRQHPALERGDAVARRGLNLVDAPEVEGRVVPAVGAREIDQSARRERRFEPVPGLVVE